MTTFVEVEGASVGASALEATHYANVKKQEGIRQAAIKAAGSNQSLVTAAELVFHRSCLASARAAGLSGEVYRGAAVGLSGMQLE